MSKSPNPYVFLGNGVISIKIEGKDGLVTVYEDRSCTVGPVMPGDAITVSKIQNDKPLEVDLKWIELP